MGGFSGDDRRRWVLEEEVPVHTCAVCVQHKSGASAHTSRVFLWGKNVSQFEVFAALKGSHVLEASRKHVDLITEFYLTTE